MEPPRQRFTAVLFYGALWALKTSQLFLMEPGSALGYSFIGLWCLLDFVYFALLRFARVPLMNYSFVATILLVVAHVFLNAGLIGWKQSEHRLPDIPWSSAGPGGKHAASIGAQKQLHDADILNSSHIIGSHLVNVRPPTLISINVDKSPFCLNSAAPTAVIPLTIRGTPPWAVDYEFWGFNGKYKKYVNVSIDGSDAITAAGREKKGRRTERYPLKVDETGVYRILGIRETAGEGALGEGRVVGKNLTAVVPCPEVRFDPADRDQTIDRCVGEKHSFNIHMTGTPPVAAWYSRRIGKTETLVSIMGEEGRWKGVPQFKAELPNDVREMLERSAVREMTSNVKVKVDVAEEHFFRLLQITDGYNNTVDYPTDVTIPPPEKGANVVHLTSIADALLVHGRRHPTVKFASCNDPKIRIGLEDSVALPVEFTGNGDYRLEWVHGPLEWQATIGDGLSTDVVDGPYTEHNIESNIYQLKVKQSGVYTLQSVSDKFCQGTVEVPSSCSVQQTFPPTVNVTSKAIEQTCFGTIGAEFDVSFTGEPPFWVEIVTEHVESGDRDVVKKELSKGRDVISFQPKHPGSYRYTFERIGDANYRAGIIQPIETQQTFTQKIHPHSNAVFTGPFKLTRCLNSTVGLDVKLDGSGPWVLGYEIMGGQQTRRFSVEVEKPNYTVMPPAFETAGRYTVDLTDIKDKNGCSQVVKGQPVQIEILAQRPEAHFSCRGPVAFLEGGKAKLPVSVSGSGDFELSYRRKGTEEVLVQRGQRRLDGIEVSSAGTFELTQIRDTHCAGFIVAPKECEAVIIPKPALEIPPSEYVNKTANLLIREPVCLDEAQIMEVHLSGRPPFKIKYSHAYQKHERGRSSVDANKVLSDYQDQSSQNFARIKLVTDKPGLHTYTFSQLSDDNYRRPIPLVKTQIVQQRVYARPDAVFLDETERTIQCIHNASDTNLRIRLAGVAPWKVQVYQKHDSNPARTEDLMVGERDVNKDGVFVWKPRDAKLTGRHTFFLISVRDGTGCENLLEGYNNPKPSTKVAIHVADVARIVPLGPQEVCVGDMLTYSLQGSAPFKVEYEWEGDVKTVEVADPMLSLFAGGAGEVRVRRVCNGLGCCHEPEREVRSLVRELPKAIVDQGKDFVDEIREGDYSQWHIDFVGTPPFSFTWSRTPLDDTHKRGKKSHAVEPEEASSVSDIQEHHYELTASQEGLFRVTSVHDKYCGYPRAIQNVAAANAMLKIRK
ncbi:hypothetical protein HK097_001220, partial [Rhizophlyctis rosea]